MKPQLRLSLAAVLLSLVQAIQSYAVDVSLVPIDIAFATRRINHTAFRVNSLKTIGDQQFAAYYDDNGLVTVARRTHGSDAWDVFNTPYVDDNSNLTDNHNVITFGVDGDGYMHLSWGMHDHDLRYVKSSTPVTGTSSISFGAEIPMVDPADEGLVTYPQFYDLPDGDLLFMYRTGQSGNGDTQLNRYDKTTASWSAIQRPLFDGDVEDDALSSKNAYPNTLAFDSQGAIHMSWTIRDTFDYRTNQNIYYAKSLDDGSTWEKTDGTAYTLPINESNSDLAVAIPEQSSLINQTSMTVDANDLPVIASWWAPGYASGNHTRQYMLAYNDGSQWQTSQVSQRSFEPKQNNTDVVEMGRPIVMVDDDNRVLVVTRQNQDGNSLTVAYSEDRQSWNYVELSSENLGDYEPNYDVDLWKRENKLNLLYQPTGVGQSSSTISVLEWDARSYFQQLDADFVLTIDRNSGGVRVTNRSNNSVSLEALTLESESGRLNGANWYGFASQGATGWEEQDSSPTHLAESGPAISYDSGATVSLGAAFGGDGLAFGVDAPTTDLQFSFVSNGETISGPISYEGESNNNLTLLIDPDTGAVRLVNTSAFSVAIEAYTITSSAGAFQTADGEWQSLDDEGVGSWSEANPSPTRVSELTESGAQLLQTGDAFEFGTLVDVARSGVFEFEFLVAGAEDAMEGIVRFASLTENLAGDYNNDGLVNAADYTVWRDLAGRFADLPNDQSEGYVSGSDYTDWVQSYGLQNFGASSSSVPEANAFGLLTIGLAMVKVASSFTTQRQG